MSVPCLLEDLSEEQKLRVLALDYVTSCGFVPPEDWTMFAAVLKAWLADGVVIPGQADIHTFPRPVE